MPTGYTAPLYEKPQTLREFVFHCAKAFFWEFRETGIDADFEKTIDSGSDQELKYRKERVDEGKAEFKKWKSYSVEDAHREMLANHKRNVKEWENSNPKRLARDARFVEMHRKISEMKVPEDDLFLCNLKKFMLEQLGMDLPSEDTEKWHKKPELPTKKDAVAYLAHEVKYAKDHLERAEKELHEYIQNVQKRKDSVKKLKKILEDM